MGLSQYWAENASVPQHEHNTDNKFWLGPFRGVIYRV